MTSAISGIIGNTNVQMNGEAGKSYENYILVKNSNSFPVKITLTGVEDISDKIVFRDNNFTLESQQQQKAYFNLSSEETGIFDGNIRVRFAGNGTSLTLSSSVKFTVTNSTGDEEEEEEQNETILVTTFIDSPAVAGEELTVRAEITNLGEDGEFSIDVMDYENWAILDELSNDTIEIGENSTEEVTLLFTIKESAAGEQSFTLEVSDGLQTQTQEVTVLVEGLGGDDTSIIPFIGNTSMTINGFIGDNLSRSILVKNVNDFPITVNITTTNASIVLLDKSLNLNPGESAQARFTAKINSTGTKENRLSFQFNANGRDSATLSSTIILIGQARLRADVAYIVRNLNGVDQNLLNEIRALGYTYETLQEPQLSSVNLNEFRLLVIGDQDLVDPAAIPIEKHKTLILNSYDYYKLSNGDTQLGWSGAKSSTTSPKMKVRNLISPISLGMAEEFNSYSVNTGKNNILKGQKPTGTDIVVSTATQSADATIASLDKGKKLLNGRTLAERHVFFGFTQARYWTSDTKKAFKNSINWLLVGEDRDADGFFSDTDCNDNNFNVNPGALEVAYDGLDNDCVGGDLKDVDRDGFDAMIAGGNDCDDQDTATNPASSDVMLNCRNDAPTVADIQQIRVSETEIVVVAVNANDPEGDELDYSITEPNFVKVGNTFSWLTTLEDEGNYTFTVTVSDGEFSVEELVQVEVTKFNRAPLLFENIPAVAWGEDRYAQIDLFSYFIDEDGDSLTFGVNLTSGNITIEAIDEDTFKFTSAENWNGEGSVVFWASDGEKITLSNTLEVYVIPLNDPLLFKGSIADITLNEDTNLTNAIDLSDYFIDVDGDELTYAFEKDKAGVDIVIENDSVSFYPTRDFNGDFKVIFEASDSEYTAKSNYVNVEVNARGELPILTELRCVTDIEEDSIYECELSAEDGEITREGEDNLTFSIGTQNNLECSVVGNVLTYNAKKDYNGAAWCEVIVSDKDGSDSEKLEVSVGAVNDGPRILSYTPTEDSVTIIEGRSKEFRMNAGDIDSNPTISWIVNGEVRASDSGGQSTYIFSQPPGFYLLEAKVRDSAFSESRVWSVIVGPTSDFTCSEVGGFIIAERETCAGSLIAVRDSSACCSIRGSPSFSDADACQLINNSVSIEITDPESDDELFIGDDIRINLNIDNNLDEDQDFDIEAHLYNMDGDKSENSVDTSFEIEAGRSRNVRLDLEVPSDIDLDENYALFVTVQDEVCSQTYREIELERPAQQVEITDFSLAGTVMCGTSLDTRVKIENLGSDDQDVRIKIANRDLKISEETEVFELKEFDESDDKETKEFSLVIPDDAEEGTYEIEATVYFNGKSQTVKEKTIVECPSQRPVESQSVSTSATLPLNERIKLNSVNYTEKVEKRFGLSLALILTVANFVMLLVIFTAARNWKRRKLENDLEVLRTRVFISEDELAAKEAKKKK